MYNRTKKLVPLNLHVFMTFSAYFYVLLTHFTLSLYFAVGLITNMLFSIYLVLVSTNFTRRSHGSKNFTGSMTYAQLCTTAFKITTFYYKTRLGSGEGALPPL